MSKLRGFNPFASEVNCLHPQIIINPRLPELVYLYGNYTIKGEFVSRRISSSEVHRFPMRMFSPYFRGIELKDVGSCYVVDFDSGQMYPVYLVVPCGHCIVCNNTKVSNFVRRCQYESMLYDCDPVHITLTYDEQHLPEDKSVSLRDTVLFKKVFRERLLRAGYPRARFLRMVLAAEYGHKNTRRPHYHLIVWNLKPDDRFTYVYFRKLAHDVWSKCIIQCLTLFPINAQYKPKGCSKTLAQMGKSTLQAFGYVAKYFFKEDASDVPPGRKPLFHTMSKSKGLGGIGAPFIDQHAMDLRSKMLKEYKFLSPDGKLFVMSYDKYLLNRVFPGRYNSVPYKVRSFVKFLCRHHAMLSVRQRGQFCVLMSKYRQLFPVLKVEYSHRFCYRTSRHCDLVNPVLISYVARSMISYLYEYLSSLDVGRVLFLENKRNLLLAKVFSAPKVTNVHQYSISLHRFAVRRRKEFIQF